MAILTPTDLVKLAPELEIDSGAINSAILTAQMIAESPMGANRPLEEQRFVETPILNGKGIIKLSRLPINNTVQKTPIVSIRGRRLLASFGLPLSDNQWIVLNPSTDYEFDYQLGEVRILSANLAGLTTESWGLGSAARARYSGRPFRRPTQAHEKSEMKVEYTTGFDFKAVPIDPRAQEIKIALISILKLQRSPMASGMKQYTLNNFYSVLYGSEATNVNTSSTDSTLLQDVLMVLKRYRPREFVS